MVALTDHNLDIQQLEIADWDEHYETSETVRIKRLAWVPVPNATGEGYFELVDQHGAEGLGVWLALVQAASRRDRRKRTGRFSGSIRTISRQSGISVDAFSAVIPTLIQVGWLQALTSASEERPDDPRTLSGRRSSKARKKSGKRLRRGLRNEEGGRMTPPSGGGSPSARAPGGPASDAQSENPTAREWAAAWARTVTHDELLRRLAARAQGESRWDFSDWDGWKEITP